MVVYTQADLEWLASRKATVPKPPPVSTASKPPRPKPQKRTPLIEIVAFKPPKVRKNAAPAKAIRTKTGKCPDSRAYDNTLPKRFRDYVLSAHFRKHVFELSLDEFEAITGMACVYCRTNERIGVDRIDSKIGYTIGNCQPCCGFCNIMKHTNSHESFLRQIERIYVNNYGDKSHFIPTLPTVG